VRLLAKPNQIDIQYSKIIAFSKKTSKSKEIHRMKKSLLALAALSSFAASTTYAQSSVTLYGVVDAGITFNNNSGGHQEYRQSGGAMQGNRFGLRGTEDLGGGLKALFVLENGFAVESGKLGQGGSEFGRQAFVGLSSDKYGKLTLGRQYDSVVDMVGSLASGSQWAGHTGAHPGDLDNLNNRNRVNNAIKYTSANYAGLTFTGLYSLGGVAGDYSRNQIFSVGAGYANGPLTLGVGYLNVRDPNYSFFGNNPDGRSATSPKSNNMTAGSNPSPVYGGYASANTQQVVSAGGAYTYGAATLGATYSNVQFKNLGAVGGNGLNPSDFSGTATFNNAEVNFKYQLTPMLLAGIAYQYTQGPSMPAGDRAKYHQVNVGTDYFLSKRTDVYLIGVWQHASGYDSTNTKAVASINGMTPSSTQNQVVTTVGIRHKF
jgi:predicted porin